MPQFTFDPTEVVAAPQSKSYEPLPRGIYQAIIIDSAIKPTKAGTGEYIELVMQVIDGVHSGRRLWERLNVSNPNKTAEEIARSQLASLCQAVGVQKLSATEQLHDTPFGIELDIDRKDPTRNRVMGYLPVGMVAQAPAPAAPTAAAGNKPWAKR